MAQDVFTFLITINKRGGFMIAFEIEVTLAATLVTALITILQVMALRRGKLEHNRQISELEKALNSDEIDSKNITNHTKTCTRMTGGKFFIHLGFGLIVFAGFSWWTLCLINGSFIEWAAPSAIFALIGIMMPFTIWKEHKQRDAIINRLTHELETRQKSLLHKDQELLSEIVIPETTEPQPEAEAADTDMFAETFAENDLFAEPVSVTETVSPAPAEVKTEPCRKPPEKQKMPQDSILKRHFITHIRAQVESSLGPRPTDSILKRHYDTQVKAEMEKYVDGPIEQPVFSSAATSTIIKPITKIEPITEIAAITETESEYESDLLIVIDSLTEDVVPAIPEVKVEHFHKPVEKQKIPEDSILRRHFLSHIRSLVESCLGPRPTDSILKRHYDTQVKAEMEKYVDGPIGRYAHTEAPSTTTPMAKIEASDEIVTIAEPNLIAEPSIVSSVTEAIIKNYPEQGKKQKMPQDSILKRHFLTHVRAQIESRFAPRPTDSILKRHYDSLIASEVEKQLEAIDA